MLILKCLMIVPICSKQQISDTLIQVIQDVHVYLNKYDLVI